MLELKNMEGHVSIKCEIVSYEFPENPADDWCLLRVKIKQGENAFEKVDPALEARDVAQLYNWFKSLSENRLPRFAHLEFTEPCISFEFLACKNERVRFSINLSHELKPNFELEQFNSSNTDWCIVFELNTDGFSEVLKGIERTINKYPSRVKS